MQCPGYKTRSWGQMPVSTHWCITQTLSLEGHGGWWWVVDGMIYQPKGYDQKNWHSNNQPNKQTNKHILNVFVRLFLWFNFLGCFTHIPEQIVVGPSDVSDGFFNLKTNNCVMVIHMSPGFCFWDFLLGLFNLRAAKPYIYTYTYCVVIYMMQWYVGHMCETNVCSHIFFFIQNICTLSWYLDF